MYYVDSQRTVSRRDSSLIINGGTRSDLDSGPTVREQSVTHLISESDVSIAYRSKGSVRKEIIISMFESMLESIVESWEVIQKRQNEITPLEISKTTSELMGNNKKKKSIGKQSKPKKSQSKMESSDNNQIELLQICWWAAPDEKAIIRFRNGNLYEGNISMKCMHGEGRYQWADGTIYLGSFKENEINGKGTIQWKNDTWYEGDFVGNLRHGYGLYVDSRKQRSYCGGWHYGTKNDEGVIYYDGTFKNCYEGEWDHNVRHGFGSREYCKSSGYKGEWDNYVREGKGLMIWPNHDFYRGEWKNGVMSGYGIYIWDMCYNTTMSCPSICAYRGFWHRGKRNGFGVLNLGFGLGSFYKGEFLKNKKHGVGKFVTNSGRILQHKYLFVNDNMTSLDKGENDNNKIAEPFTFDICDNSVGLLYHIEKVIKNIDKQSEIRAKMVSDFIENNKHLHIPQKKIEDYTIQLNFEDLINFEISSLSKSLRCYESRLKLIYYQYAKICNKQEIYFTPILIRLYLWQLYYDCNIHDKGLTLVEIDNLFHENPEWLSKNPHTPFDKIYFWQFQHSLITVASKLYAKRQLPDEKPDTMLANAFRVFMEKDILPGTIRTKGKLVESYGIFVPLRSLYKLYSSLGETCTVRKFLCSVRPPPHYSQPQPSLVDGNPIMGKNAYIFGDELTFTSDYTSDLTEYTISKSKSKFKLFNISNLPTQSILKIFSMIFPQIYDNEYIMDLNIEITFFEFYQIFVTCVEESIRVTDDNMRIQEKILLPNVVETQTTRKNNKQ